VAEVSYPVHFTGPSWNEYTPPRAQTYQEKP
jgi:hypothetical protein